MEDRKEGAFIFSAHLSQRLAGQRGVSAGRVGRSQGASKELRCVGLNRSPLS